MGIAGFAFSVCVVWGRVCEFGFSGWFWLGWFCGLVELWFGYIRLLTWTCVYCFVWGCFSGFLDFCAI